MGSGGITATSKARLSHSETKTLFGPSKTHSMFSHININNMLFMIVKRMCSSCHASHAVHVDAFLVAWPVHSGGVFVDFVHERRASDTGAVPGRVLDSTPGRVNFYNFGDTGSGGRQQRAGGEGGRPQTTSSHLTADGLAISQPYHPPFHQPWQRQTSTPHSHTPTRHYSTADSAAIRSRQANDVARAVGRAVRLPHRATWPASVASQRARETHG